MTTDLALAVATTYRDLMQQAAQYAANGFVPCGSPFVPPQELWVPMDGEEGQPPKPQLAWAFVRVRQDLVSPVVGVPGAVLARRPS
jgi:hypothetical protein